MGLLVQRLILLSEAGMTENTQRRLICCLFDEIVKPRPIDLQLPINSRYSVKNEPNLACVAHKSLSPGVETGLNRVLVQDCTRMSTISTTCGTVLPGPGSISNQQAPTGLKSTVRTANNATDFLAVPGRHPSHPVSNLGQPNSQSSWLW